MSDMTAIPISKQTANELKEVLKKSETYDQGICRLIKEWSDNN